MTEAACWSLPFARWLRRYGITRAARELQVTRQAVYRLAYGRTAPRADVALTIERLSGGEMAAREIYAHREAVRARQALS